jgi:hypothetical protein
VVARSSTVGASAAPIANNDERAGVRAVSFDHSYAIHEIPHGLSPMGWTVVAVGSYGDLATSRDNSVRPSWQPMSLCYTPEAVSQHPDLVGPARPARTEPRPSTRYRYATTVPIRPSSA